MDSKNIENLLQQLHTEIERTEHMDEKGKELLRELSSDIQELLERSDAPGTPKLSLTQRLEESVDHFEVTHPTLTTMLSELLNSLSNAGI